MMTSTELLSAAMLKRKAVVYIRQSTQAQVQSNLESQRRQYELVDAARERGFRLSRDRRHRRGSRPFRHGLGGTAPLRTAGCGACPGEVGAVQCFDASRFARNERDWHHQGGPLTIGLEPSARRPGRQPLPC